MRARSLIAVSVATLVACGGGTSPSDETSDSSASGDTTTSTTDSGTKGDSVATTDSGKPSDSSTTGDSSSSADGDAIVPGDTPSGDLDLDGLDDATEAKWADDYFPYLSIH